MATAKLANQVNEYSGIETNFDVSFATRLALREKQIQQNYRPIIGIHKWFARRPGTIFRSLLISEFGDHGTLEQDFWKPHDFRGVIADPFMGGGTPIFEANRLGFHVVGADVNPMAFWIVRQALAKLDLDQFRKTAEIVLADIESEIGEFYVTKCMKCRSDADVKYFLWVKTAECPTCGTKNDLFPGYLLAENKRHPLNVLVCKYCGELNEYEKIPTREFPQKCASCNKKMHVEGNCRREKAECQNCNEVFLPLSKGQENPLQHRIWAIEYHCQQCKPNHVGRFFKSPDKWDLEKIGRASLKLKKTRGLPIPDDAIPAGDETDRLHRWGYKFYREMFNERQLLGLGLLLRRIIKVQSVECRQALLTVFSDILRYQNMLCRYDTYALKCQDIFSVHGFPIGLVQCENNLLGIPKIGSGAFRHFIEKYIRAKDYCEHPFETKQDGATKTIVPIIGEQINAEFVSTFPNGTSRQAKLLAVPAWEMPVPQESLDGVFTDPPYFDNVQYAELMDFCFTWLRIGLKKEFPEFDKKTTRTQDELTGNVTLGRGLHHFTEGLTKVFSHYAAALKPNAPFVFTYHHNDARAYLPLVVAILDASLDCTATLPAAAEMNASMHIAGTNSSVLDSVFVCRQVHRIAGVQKQINVTIEAVNDIERSLDRDIAEMQKANLRISLGDKRCLVAGHIARLSINLLYPVWDTSLLLDERMRLAERTLDRLSKHLETRKIGGQSTFLI
ncbi:MAG: DNA methylase [Deltaproteobacteria bacterium]|nr:DNA methylase [Deltaproteobacteria bacterium]